MEIRKNLNWQIPNRQTKVLTKGRFEKFAVFVSFRICFELRISSFGFANKTLASLGRLAAFGRRGSDVGPRPGFTMGTDFPARVVPSRHAGQPW